MPLSVWARGDSSNAANASLNASNTNQQPTTLLTFSADYLNNGSDAGDLKLDFTLDGSPDPDTVIFLDSDGDGELDPEPVSFTMEFGGTLPFTNKLNGVGPNNNDLRGEEIVILTLEDGTRLFFLRSFLFDPDGPTATTDSQDTFDIMDDFPNGAHDLQGLFVCYVAGTLIETPTGAVAVETLKPGDQILSEASARQSVLFVGQKTFPASSLRAFPNLRPITVPKNSLAPGAPNKDLTVSPLHRILVRDAALTLLFGEDAVFVMARDLPAARPAPIVETTYVHVLCKTHCVLKANGCESESLFPGDVALMSLSRDDRDIIKQLLGPSLDQKTAYPCLTSKEAALWRAAVHKREKRTA